MLRQAPRGSMRPERIRWERRSRPAESPRARHREAQRKTRRFRTKTATSIGSSRGSAGAADQANASRAAFAEISVFVRQILIAVRFLVTFGTAAEHAVVAGLHARAC